MEAGKQRHTGELSQDAEGEHCQSILLQRDELNAVTRDHIVQRR